MGTRMKDLSLSDTTTENPMIALSKREGRLHGFEITTQAATTLAARQDFPRKRLRPPGYTPPPAPAKESALDLNHVQMLPHSGGEEKTSLGRGFGHPASRHQVSTYRVRTGLKTSANAATLWRRSTGFGHPRQCHTVRTGLK